MNTMNERAIVTSEALMFCSSQLFLGLERLILILILTLILVPALSQMLILILALIRGHSKKSVSETRAPREVGFFALCSGGKNLITHSAKKKLHFFANFAVIFLDKKNSNLI